MTTAVTNHAVPVSMGSPRFRTWETRNCLVTHVWFPEGVVLEPHVHDRATFAIVLRGGFDLDFTSPGSVRSSFACPPGTVVTQPAGEKHANRIGLRGAEGVVVQPSVTYAALPPRSRLLLDRFTHFCDAAIATSARRLAREIRSPDDVTSLAVDAAVFEMLADATRRDVRCGLDAGSVPRWLQRATEYVHDHFREPLRIADIAATAGIYPGHLAACFRRLHRVPLASYVRRLRVDWAGDQLVRTQLPISEIALAAGFADQAHLTRWFRRATGSTPARYRQARS